MSIPGEKKFCCPLCGSKKYSEIPQSDDQKNDIAEKLRFFPPISPYCICDGCTVRFSDPVKFSNVPDINAKEILKSAKNRTVLIKTINAAKLFTSKSAKKRKVHKKYLRETKITI